MINRLLGALSSRVSAADLVVKSEETLSLSLDEHGVHSAVLARSQGVQLRVVYQGRVGWAGTTRDDPSALPEAAIAAAAVGESLELFLPAPASTPSVLTHSRAAASAGSTDLADLGRALQERLAHPRRRVEAWIERSAGEVQVANTRGVVVDYQADLVGLGAVVEPAAGEAAPPFRVHVAGTALPTHLEIE